MTGGPVGYKFIKELGRMTCDKTMKKKKSSFKVNSAQEACAKCFSVHMLKGEMHKNGQESVLEVYRQNIAVCCLQNIE